MFTVTFVYDSAGNEYLSKFTQPTSGNAEVLQPRRMEQGGNVQTRDKQRRILEDLATDARRWIGLRIVTLGQLGLFLATRGFRMLAIEARLNMKAPVANFRRAFPDTFVLEVNNTGASYVKVLRAQPAFEGAVRLRRRNASGD